MPGAVQPKVGPPLLPTRRLTWEELESFLDVSSNSFSGCRARTRGEPSSDRHGPEWNAGRKARWLITRIPSS